MRICELPLRQEGDTCMFSLEASVGNYLNIVTPAVRLRGYSLVVFSVQHGGGIPSPLSSEKGMFRYLSSSQMMVLVDCLEEAHVFSKIFNTNNEQRTLLMKAGMDSFTLH